MTPLEPTAVDVICDVLESLKQKRPQFRASCTTEDMDPWRVRIDTVDRAIITLMNERAICALEIGRIKKQLDIPVYVPTREEEVLDNVMTSNPGPLADLAVRRLYERIIDETRALERGTYQENSGADPPKGIE